MDFVTSVKTCFAKYATFQGRATRSEYWYFFLFNVILGLITLVIDDQILANEIGPVNWIVTIATFLPSLAVGVRRLHDIDRSGWWTLIIFVPVVGIVVLIAWACIRGTDGDNRFGPPWNGDAAAMPSAA